MTTATIRCNDHPKLAPHEQCGHCGLVAPPFPPCWGCQRPMTDWPQAPELFLEERGWEKIDGLWHEPLARCYGPIPDGVELGQEWRDSTKWVPSRINGMIEEAEAAVLNERAWSSSLTLQRMQKGPQMLRAGFRDGGAQLVKDGPDRDPQQEATDSLAKAEARLEELIRLRDSGGLVQLRERHRSPLDQAVRDELNRDIGDPPSVAREEPKYSEQDIQNMLPANQRANKSVEASGKKSDIPMEYPHGKAGGPGRPRHVFADERRLRAERCTVHYEPCCVCRRYPDKFNKTA